MADLDEALAQDFAAMQAQLHLALALGAETSLRASILAGRRCVALRFPNSECWNIVTPKGSSLSREAGSYPQETDLAGPALSETVLTAARRLGSWDALGKRADRLLLAFLYGDRRTFAAALEWAPLIEQIAYRAATRAMTIMDQERTGVLAKAEHHGSAAREERRYWSLLQSMARLTLVATTRGSAGWLGAMTKSFPWITWTPSFPLVRERSLGMLAIGAGVAAEIGPGILDDYAEALALASYPIAALDVIVGLTAIAIRHTDAHASALRHLSRTTIIAMDAPEFVMLGLVQARKILTGSGGLEPPRSSASFLSDPFEFSVRGECNGLAMLPRFLEQRPMNLLPPSGLSHLMNGENVILRAWGRTPPAPIVGKKETVQ